ncbi:hypothetical protein [Clostridium uliginosum]|uniref:RDD family protein n=1 Tax=Clostridium uliginosum TaxID=119641 RepID=A0A1I1I2Y7_9CLOT|nr:hypothetical protein [Clostridium uliginosum]SFC30395.1 hypothetical protein SAMN05421842_10298 [Clostridium uliginosum]
MNQDKNNINESKIQDKKVDDETMKNESSQEKSTNSDNEVEDFITVKNEDCINEDIKKEINYKPSLLLKLFSTAIDQIVTLAISGIVLVIFDFILKVIGYNVLMPLAFLLIFYYLVNVLYTPIVEKTRLKKSIGKRILNID